MFQPILKSLVVSTLALIVAVCPAAALPSSLSCADAIVLAPGESLTWIDAGDSVSPLLALTPEIGDRLALEAHEVSGGTSPLWLEVIHADCSDTAGAFGSQSFLDRAVLDIERQGTVLVRAGRVVEEERPVKLRLVSHLVSGSGTSPSDKDGEPGDNTEEEDLEIMPLVGGGGCESRTSEVSPVSMDKDGDPGDNTEEEDLEIMPFTAPAPCARSCAGLEPANGTLYCARSIAVGDSLDDVLAAFDGFDRDYFTFSLESVRSVSIEAKSEVRLHAAILDAHGRPVAADTMEGGGSLHATLGEGRYFIRVEGEGEGDYRLTFRHASAEFVSD